MRETPYIKKKEKRKEKSYRRVSKRNSPHKNEEARMGCVIKFPMGRNVRQLIFEEMCQFWLSICVSLSLAICLFLFCFVGLFLRLSFIKKNWLKLFCLCITLRVPFTSERFCGGLFLGFSPLAPL